MSVTIVGKVPEIRRSVEVLQEEGHKAMTRAVELARTEIERTAPKGRTGRLGRNVYARAHLTKTGVSGTVRPREHYAKMVDRGTGLYAEHHHAITPKDPASRPGGKRMGPFIGRGGERLFRRKVKGQRPTLFVERAEQAVEQKVVEILELGADRATRRLAP